MNTFEPELHVEGVVMMARRDFFVFLLSDSSLVAETSYICFYAQRRFCRRSKTYAVVTGHLCTPLRDSGLWQRPQTDNLGIAQWLDLDLCVHGKALVEGSVHGVESMNVQLGLWILAVMTGLISEGPGITSLAIQGTLISSSLISSSSEMCITMLTTHASIRACVLSCMCTIVRVHTFAWTV